MEVFIFFFQQYGAIGMGVRWSSCGQPNLHPPQEQPKINKDNLFPEEIARAVEDATMSLGIFVVIFLLLIGPVVVGRWNDIGRQKNAISIKGFPVNETKSGVGQRKNY